MTRPQTADRVVTPSAAAPAPAPPSTWRGVAANARRYLALRLATLAVGIPLMYLLLASTWTAISSANWATVPPSESELLWATWQFRLAGGAQFWTVEWGYPPLLVAIPLFAALPLMAVNQGMATPIRKAKRRLVSTRWAAATERARMRAELHAAGYRGLATPNAGARLLVGGLLTALGGAAALALPVEAGFTRGYGATVCAVGAVLASLAVLLATPWSHWPTVVLLADGRLLIDGVEPLAEVVPPPAVPVAPLVPTPVPPGSGAGAPPASGPAPPPPSPPPPSPAPPLSATG